jgi:uncharacterized membrane protein (UPF0127 family)
MNKSIIKAVVVCSLFLILALVLYNLRQTNHFEGYKTADLNIGDRYIKVYLADTEQKREIGLGKTQKIETNQGMLFIFERPDTYHFWMKDMLFNIDLICIDMSEEVNQLHENLDPKLFPAVYECPFPTQYAIELKAGEISSMKLKLGDTIRIKNI